MMKHKRNIIVISKNFTLLISLIREKTRSTSSPSNRHPFHLFQKTEERSIQLAVRVHKTLELADDKFYVITCGKTGFSR